MHRPSLYLDIESDRGRITVLGLLSTETGMHQWVGWDVKAEPFRSALPRGGRLFTFNGNGFDIPWTVRATGVDLWRRFECVDLLPICRRLGMRGGQKGVERRVGFTRFADVAGLHGRHAVLLWRKFLAGDRNALGLLLRYNRVDLYGMRAIHEHLAGRGLV